MIRSWGVMTLVAILTGGLAFTLTAAASCENKPEPAPEKSSICGTTQDGLIYCTIPSRDPMPTMGGGK